MACRGDAVNRTLRLSPTALGKHTILVAYTLLAVVPVMLIILNSFKERNAIFRTPIAPPTADTFTTRGYETLVERGDFGSWLFNSVVITGVALALVLLLGSMAAFALARYRFIGNRLLGLYLALGIMIPIRLGTVSLLDSILEPARLTNTLLGPILIYTAAGLPLAVFVLANFFREVPRDLEDAARVDGAGHGRIFSMVVRLARPAIAAVAILTMIPIWNDLWWPLIVSPGVPTLTLGSQQFLGQFVSDWNAVLAALTVAMIPMLVLYIVFNRQFVRGLMGGAIK
jgi:raffinose/stachyose/melibiose transport system permease protein